MSFIQNWIGLSKSYIFMESDQIMLLANLFQHVLSTEILSEWKIEFIFVVTKTTNQK